MNQRNLGPFLMERSIDGGVYITRACCRIKYGLLLRGLLPGNSPCICITMPMSIQPMLTFIHLKFKLGNKIISDRSDNPGPSKSPNINPLDFSSVYQCKHETLDNLMNDLFSEMDNDLVSHF